jgi:hypothetical protein
MTRTRGIGACIVVAGQVALGCSGDGAAFDASARAIIRPEDIGTGGLPPAPRPGTPEREGRDPKTSLERERAELFHRAKALNVCASTLGDGSMHTVVQCSPGMHYDHDSERCFAATYTKSSSTGDDCRNGEDRCVGSVAQACASGRWRVLRTHATDAACEEGLLTDHMRMIE